MLMKERITDREFLVKLRHARRLVQRGWVQKAFCRCACYCASGALARAGIPLSQVRFEDASTPLSAELIGWMALVNWNDRPERTKAEVLACFDNSIAALEKALPSGSSQ